ncbi:phosphomannomutase/phosphoglucomutase [Marinobacter sp. HL-58]|uniref:phosphomannomutase/phosphoglucomutase n=1 Tax=Marinobacter sp. HL-58 TaxID=1479237 RepID=UPI0004829FB8|nr:phosphomannomutase/phosphoglucomutase [Marinobacter sp. HL-58]KPQ02852.1 MAG: bifunctional phosphomannomutase / phosphoglucomutase Pmm-Pgm [Marinobacter sp. HL-58]
MKLGKKKNSEEAAPDGKPDRKQAKKQSKDRKAAGGPRHKRLSSVSMAQALVVVAAGAVSAILLYFLLTEPSEARRYEMQAALEADTAAVRVSQQFSLLQSAVEGIASQDHVLAALRGESSTDEVAADLAGTLPGLEAVYLFPYGDIPRSANEPTLGFAGLDLARRAETGRKLYPDAFPRDGQWYLQMASPVRNPQSRAVAGSVLMVFDTEQLQPLLSGVNQELGGQFSLVQSVDGSNRTIVSQGSGNGPVQARDLTNPDWELQYRPAASPEPLVNSTLAIILALVPAIVAAIVVWLLLGNAQKGLRQEVTVMIQWAHKVFGGERIKPPALKWDMVASTAEVLHRLSQMVEKRVAKAGESARPKAGAGGQAQKPAADEPLFQDKDMLDIDMLDGDDDVLGFGGSGGPEDTPEVEEVSLPEADVSDTIFRAYDIRGIVGETLTPDIVTVIGRAIGSEAIERGVDSLCIGYDGRHSSPELSDALARGVMATGCNVIHVGAVPTPVLYFATHELGTGSGVMVTGSHNPANYNGLKIMLGGDTLSGDAIQKLLQRIRTGDFASGQGNQSSEDVRRAYLDRIVGDIAVAAPLKVVVDAGNGIAGELAPLLIEELGCEVIPLYCEVDGDFPNHHPDPGKPENLADLIDRVKTEGADIGLAFDGDGDRLGVVTNTGKIIWPDRLLMLFARDVVSRNPGADVLYDVKCSRRLAGVISEAGGRPIMWKTGHSLMKAKMKETGALLAGEMSGHIFFGERWLGFDDGLYSAARLLEILGIEDRHCDEVFEDFPEDISTPELNVEVSEETKFDLVERLGRDGNFGDANISTIDGIRVEYTDGWGLCRASNTTPVLVLRFEAETEEALERIKAVFREQLQKVAPDLVADF